MPGVDGMALLEELRSRFPNLPIINADRDQDGEDRGPGE